MLSIFSACKNKETPVDKCQNGFMDPGESGIDCGGECPPCDPSQSSYLFMEYNGIGIIGLSKELNYDGGIWTLNAYNDSLTFQFNLGSDGTPGSYIMSPNGTFATKNGTSYMIATDGSYAISEHNTQTQKMSGFFQVNFSRVGFTDTIRISSGQFDYLSY